MLETTLFHNMKRAGQSTAERFSGSSAASTRREIFTAASILLAFQRLKCYVCFCRK